MLDTADQRRTLVETIVKAAYDDLDQSIDDRDPIGPDGFAVFDKAREKLTAMGLQLSVEALDEAPERVPPRITSIGG